VPHPFDLKRVRFFINAWLDLNRSKSLERFITALARALYKIVISTEASRRFSSAREVEGSWLARSLLHIDEINHSSSRIFPGTFPHHSRTYIQQRLPDAEAKKHIASPQTQRSKK